MTKTFKRMTAFLLALVLCVSMIPVAAFAEETDSEAVSTEETEIVLPVEAPEDSGEPAEITEEINPENEPVLEQATQGENVDGGDVAKVNTPTASHGGPRKAKGTKEIGKLRVLYYTMDDSTSVDTTTMGNLCGVPAHSIIMADGKTQKAAYCLNHDRSATEG